VAGVGEPELAVHLAGGAQPVARVGHARGRFVLGPDQVGEAARRDGADQRLHVVEVQVHRGCRDAGLPGDRAQRQRRCGRVFEQAGGRLDDVLAQPLALAARVPLAAGLVAAHPGSSLSPAG